MSVLFKLREWLTVAEAAKHLTILFGEDVTEADVLRLALDGHLRISIYFVNSMRAERGAVVPIEKAQFREMSLPEIALMEEWRSLEFEVPCPFPYYPRVLVGSYFSDRVVFQPEGGPQLFKGIFDLLLIDDGRQGVEARYQSLTGGAKVDMEFFIDSALLLHDPDSGASLLLCHEPRKSRRYGRGDPLPNDSRLVVRTAALRELEASINAASESPAQPMATTNRDHVSDKLAFLNQAAAIFWANKTREERSKHPKNADVVAWLIQREYSQSLAQKAVSIIRPEWAPTGRKPEE